MAGWPGEAIAAWIGLCRTASDLPVSEFVASPCVTRPADAVLAAYDAPFPTRASKIAARLFPGFVPVEADNPAVPDQLAATVRAKVIVDGRNCLDVGKWQGAGWRVHALGRNLAA